MIKTIKENWEGAVVIILVFATFTGLAYWVNRAQNKAWKEYALQLATEISDQNFADATKGCHYRGFMHLSPEDTLVQQYQNEKVFYCINNKTQTVKFMIIRDGETKWIKLTRNNDQ